MGILKAAECIDLSNTVIPNAAATRDHVRVVLPLNQAKHHLSTNNYLALFLVDELSFVFYFCCKIQRVQSVQGPRALSSSMLPKT